MDIMPQEDVAESCKYNPLNRYFTVGALLGFSFPTLFMMVFSGFYTVVDTIFVSRLVTTNALSSINIVTPIINLIVGLSAMLATGGSAIVACKLGERRDAEARKDLTLIVLTALVLGLIIFFIGLLFLEPIIYVLGGSSIIVPYAKTYLSILLFFAPINMIQIVLTIFLITAGNPGLGFILTLLTGLTNILLDFIFMGPLHCGIGGAALATGIGYTIQAVGGVIYFLQNRKGSLYFVMPHFNLKVIIRSIYNGSSEMVGHLSSAVSTFLFNISMIKLIGIDGVAAITIIIYSQYLLTSLYLGFSMGVAPVFSYNYGKQDKVQMKRLFKICFLFILFVSVFIFSITMIGGPCLASIFASKGSNVYSITKTGFLIVSFSFLFSGLNIFSSSLFTALSNGKYSAIISFLRSLVFPTLGIILLPLIIGISGIWFAIPFAEILTFVFSLTFIWKSREKYKLL